MCSFPRSSSNQAIHLLRDRVLSGDFDTALNEYLATNHTSEFEVQVDKTEFFERYERQVLGERDGQVTSEGCTRKTVI